MKVWDVFFVGTKVRVCSREKMEKYIDQNYGVVDPMLNFCDGVYTISHIFSHDDEIYVDFEEDVVGWNFNQRLIEKEYETCKIVENDEINAIIDNFLR